ncbi:stigma-specific STIG1-like protein 4 [Syzygium oleosum]|uniref:stigma-specific STIG1-like protein 4 n=1 Tax=Syzygium oleosum TaxID=219896 RepID=UPI0024B969DD|nr:stigma-specific STIG1-like protein 4 [Syzygium oleosum]
MEAKPTTSRIGKNETNASLSPWLKTVLKNKDKDKDPRDKDPRAVRCRGRPWICNQGSPPFRMQCCKNRCVDITSHVNHCGACLIRCPFTWQCCSGLCRNININPIHCGRCFNRCPFGVPCLFGLCGYAWPLLPRRPDPFKPRPPKPYPPHPWPRPPKGYEPPAVA